MIPYFYKSEVDRSEFGHLRIVTLVKQNANLKDKKKHDKPL